MTRADTAERALISSKNLHLLLQKYIPTELLRKLIFYGPGSMLVILFIFNITVDYLHYGIIYSTNFYLIRLFFILCHVGLPVGRTVLVEYSGVSLVLVLSTVIL